MFGEMRRKKQALPLETCEKILERGETQAYWPWREKRAILMQSPQLFLREAKDFFPLCQKWI